MVADPYAQQLSSLSFKLREFKGARDRLLAEIADLDGESNVVQVEYNRTVNRSSGIAKLPNEMLSYIFETMTSHRREPAVHPELLVSQVYSCLK